MAHSADGWESELNPIVARYQLQGLTRKRCVTLRTVHWVALCGVVCIVRVSDDVYHSLVDSKLNVS